jgi:hypothetical protein
MSHRAWPVFVSFVYFPNALLLYLRSSLTWPHRCFPTQCGFLLVAQCLGVSAVSESAGGTMGLLRVGGGVPGSVLGHKLLFLSKFL